MLVINRGRPWYAYLSNVASGSDSQSSSYLFADISLNILRTKEQSQLRDTRLNDTSASISIYAHLRISTPSLSILSLQSYLNYCRNVLDTYKNKTNVRQNPCCVAMWVCFSIVHTMINWLFVFWLDNGIYTCIILVLRTLHSFTLQLNLHSTCSHRAWYNMYRHFNHSENWLSRQDIHVTTWELTESTRHTRNDVRTD